VRLGGQVFSHAQYFHKKPSLGSHGSPQAGGRPALVRRASSIIIKEVDLRLNFTSAFRSLGNHEALDTAQLQQRKHSTCIYDP